MSLPPEESESQCLWWVSSIGSVSESVGGASAVLQAQGVLSALAALPDSASRRRIRASLTLEIARVQWIDPDFSLPCAIGSVAESRALLDADAPLATRSRMAMVLADVAHDMGELRWIELALGELTELIRALSAQSEPTAAARRMLDLAALHLRVGDPVQAAYMVQESRAIFDASKADAPEAQAVADHLTAMLPLHAAARIGTLGSALATARERCLSAEEYFMGEGAEREACRARETLGRLEVLGAKHDHAEETLRSVILRQEPIGDLVGLGRSLGALGGLLASQGRAPEALDSLCASIGCNRQKSSALGVAINRRAFNSLSLIGFANEVQLRATEVSRLLAAAEASVGGAAIPSEGAALSQVITDRPMGG